MYSRFENCRNLCVIVLVATFVMSGVHMSVHAGERLFASQASLENLGKELLVEVWVFMDTHTREEGEFVSEVEDIVKEEVRLKILMSQTGFEVIEREKFNEKLNQSRDKGGPSANAYGPPKLDVEVECRSLGDLGYAYHIKAHLSQEVLLYSNLKQMYAVTWYCATMRAPVPAERLEQHLKSTTAEIIDLFLTTYLLANQRDAEKEED